LIFVRDFIYSYLQEYGENGEDRCRARGKARPSKLIRPYMGSQRRCEMLELILIGVAWKRGWRGYALLPILSNIVLFYFRIGYALWHFGSYQLDWSVSDILAGDGLTYLVLGLSVSFMLVSYWSLIPSAVLIYLAAKRRLRESLSEEILLGAFALFFLTLLALFVLKIRIQ
jgi:hypothetical protein